MELSGHTDVQRWLDFLASIFEFTGTSALYISPAWMWNFTLKLFWSLTPSQSQELARFLSLCQVRTTLGQQIFKTTWAGWNILETTHPYLAKKSGRRGGFRVYTEGIITICLYLLALILSEFLKRERALINLQIHDRQQRFGTPITGHDTKKEESGSLPLSQGHHADFAPHSLQHFRGSALLENVLSGKIR